MDTDVLATLIDQKGQVLTQLHQLAVRQAGMLREGDVSHLLGLLAAKQKLLDALQIVERQLVPFRNQDPEARRWRSPDHRERARRSAEQCEAALREIVLLEQACEIELVRRRDRAAQRLQGVHDAAQAARAYTTGGAVGGSQLDVSSGR